MEGISLKNWLLPSKQINASKVNNRNARKSCEICVRPQFVDTLFIARLRLNMSMRRAVIINY